MTHGYKHTCSGQDHSAVRAEEMNFGQNDPAAQTADDQAGNRSGAERASDAADMDDRAASSSPAQPSGGRGQVCVIHTQTGYEREVLQAMKEYVLLPSEEAFLPVIERPKRIHGVDRIVERDLYPGYFFIRTDNLKDVYFRGQSSKGRTVFRYIHMLRNEEYLLPLPDDEVQMIYDLCGETHRCEISRGIIVGDQVIVTEGPLRTFRGQINRIDRHKKTAQITMKLFNRQVRVLVGLEILEKLPGEQARAGANKSVSLP